MSSHVQPSELRLGRNHALARDLENLPLELIEEVIKETNFERIIRLSSWAGPRLTEAFTISPSWKHLLGEEEDRKTWQKCLRLTDDINVLCFDTRRDPRAFFEARSSYRCWHKDRFRCPCSKDVSFLQGGYLSKTCDAHTVRQLWLEALSTRLRSKISRNVNPLLEGVEGYLEAEQTLFKQIIDTRHGNLSADELDTGIRLYQRALAARRTTLATELRRLASLSEAHPTLLKVPFAPQAARPRAAHIPQQLRARARKLEKTPLTLHHRATCRTYFQNEFLALVPYDWTIRFFVAVMEKGKIPSDKCQFVLDGMACYFLRKTEHNSNHDNVRTVGTQWSLSSYQRGQPEFLAGKEGPPRGNVGSYATHTGTELTWLEIFVEVVAELATRFPQDAEAAQVERNRKEAEPDALAEAMATKSGLLRRQ